MAGFKGSYGKVKEEWRERNRTWAHALNLSVLGFSGWGLIGQSNQKSRVLVNPWGVLCKKHKKGRPWEAWGTVDHKGFWGSHISNLFTFTCDSVAAIQGVFLLKGAGVSLKSLQAAWSNKMDVEAAIRCSKTLKICLLKPSVSILTY